jgi:predicted transcriptional regulator
MEDRVKKSTFLTLKVQPQLIQALDRLAESERRTRSMMTQLLIEEAMRAREAKREAVAV